MAVDAGLVTVTPHEPERVVPDGLNVAQLEVATLHEFDRTLVTLTVRAGTEAAQQLVRIRAAMPVRPIDLHDPCTSRGTELDWLWRRVTH